MILVSNQVVDLSALLVSDALLLSHASSTHLRPLVAA